MTLRILCLTLTICVWGRSSLLDSSAEIRAIKDRGELVPDTLVGDALLAQIFDPEVNDGVGLVIDGFPRTALQVRKGMEGWVRGSDQPGSRPHCPPGTDGGVDR